MVDKMSINDSLQKKDPHTPPPQNRQKKTLQILMLNRLQNEDINHHPGEFNSLIDIQ